MPSVLAYHRPQTLDAASELSHRPNTRLIGGGTVVVPDARVPGADGVEIVDLQALGLDTIAAAPGESLTLGAMVRLGALAVDERVPALVRDLARRELPSALRNQATIGGTVALGARDSVLVAGLLVHGAEVDIHGGGTMALADLLAADAPAGLITAIRIACDGAGSIAATGRTPADDPIVAAIARDASAGVRVALTGVAATPVEVDPADPTAGLEPSGDFRGSSAYRLHLASTLTRRVVQEVST